MKRLIDEKGRLFGRINAIDALALLLAVVLAVVCLLRTQRLSEAGLTEDEPELKPVQIRYEVTVYNASIGHVEDIWVGDILYNRDTNGVLVGNIVDVQVSDCYLPSQVLDGSYVMAPVRGRYCIVLTVEAEAKRDESGRLFVTGSEVAMGLSYNYCTKYCLITGVVTGLDWDAEALTGTNGNAV